MSAFPSGPAKRHLRPHRSFSGLIKGEAHAQRGEDLVPAFSASGQDVWISPEVAYAHGPGLVLSAVGARCGKVFSATFERWGTVANTQSWAIAPTSEVRYVSYLLNDEAFWQKGGAAQPYVLVGESLRQTVPLPDRSAQVLVADYLDRETAEIDAFIADQDELIALLEERRRTAVATAIAGKAGIDHGVRPIPWLNALPQSWSAVAIRDMARPRGTLFADGDWIESPYIEERGVRLIQTGNVGVGRFREQGFRYVSEQTFVDLNCTEVLPDDLLISRLGEPVSRACLAPDLGVRMITSVDVAILRPRPDIERRYLNYVLNNSSYLEWVSSLVRGSTRDRISRSMLGSFPLPLPPLREQMQIANDLDLMTTGLDVTIADAREAIALSKERRGALISAAVTGQIDVTKKKRVLV